MRYAAPVLAISMLLAPAAVMAGEQVSFDPEAVRAHVTFLADDNMDGRMSGSKGYAIAANYVATQFMGMGAAPMGDPAKGSYYQQVPLRESSLVGQPAITITGKGKSWRLDSRDQVLTGPNPAEEQQAIEAPLVFAGFGMDRPELGLNDYAGLDVKGKIVVLLSGYPKGLNSELGAHLSADKARMAMKRGAIGVFTVPTKEDTSRRSWKRRAEMSGEPRSNWLQADGSPFLRAPGIRADASINPEVAAQFFGTGKHSLESVLAEADKKGGKPKGFALGVTAKLERTSKFRPYTSPNVIAMIPGSDPSVADEYVLMTAHLDHIGDHGKGDDKINNGAMDNAAGIATMLEVAKALAKDGKRPRRPILFAAVTNEEGGLLAAGALGLVQAVAAAGGHPGAQVQGRGHRGQGGEGLQHARHHLRGAGQFSGRRGLPAGGREQPRHRRVDVEAPRREQLHMAVVQQMGADTAAGFQHHHRQAALDQLGHGGQAHGAGAEHGDGICPGREAGVVGGGHVRHLSREGRGGRGAGRAGGPRPGPARRRPARPRRNRARWPGRCRRSCR